MIPARGRPKRSMATQARPRYRKDAGWDSDTRNRVAQPYCSGADNTRRRGLSGAQRAMCQPEQDSISISISTTIGLIGLIGLIGSYCLEAEAKGIVLFRRIFSHRGHRVHREILPFAIGGFSRGNIRWEMACASVFSVTSVARHSSPEPVGKGQGRRKLGLGVAIGINIEWTRDGIWT